MRPLTRALLSAALLALPASARAQFAVQPAPSLDAPNANSQAIVRPTVVQPVVVPQFNPYFSPWGGFWAPYGFYGSPVGNYLNGLANVTTANAQALVTTQAARQASFQADAAQLDLRRRLFDQMRYERMNTPTPEDIRQHEQQMALRRARNMPPQTEIWSGAALNALFQNIQQTQAASGAFGPSVPLDPALLKRINLTTGTTRSGGSMLAERLRWPLPLAVERYDAEREQIEKLVKEAVAQVEKYGNAEARTLVALRGAIQALQARSDADITRMTPSDSIRSDRFLGELRDAVRVLEQPNAANFFNGRFAAKGNTVGELVQHLTQNGLKFAPANEGDEASYTSLYNALLTYDAGLMRLVSR
jgi:hypothetical protein